MLPIELCVFDANNPQNAAKDIYNSATKVLNIFNNDFFQVDLRTIPCDDLISCIQSKYPSELALLKKYIESFKTYCYHNIKKGCNPALESLRHFSNIMLGRSEIILRLSAGNPSTKYQKMGLVICDIMNKFDWVNAFYDEVMKNLKQTFDPLIDSCFRASRLDPIDLYACGLAAPLSYNKNISVGFDTAYNCYETYAQRLQFINPNKEQIIKKDIETLLSLLDKSSFDVCLNSINLKYISSVNNVYEAANDYKPFVKTNQGYYTNATLVCKYIENYISNACESSKRYQIKAGFLFEKRMINEIPLQMYDIIDIKRTSNHREFDVIIQNRITKDIINIQCKNYALHLYKFSKDASQTRKRVEYVMNLLQKALDKEIKREPDLVNELKRRNIHYNTIKHIVVSKQQIPSNDDIMDYSNFIKNMGSYY